MTVQGFAFDENGQNPEQLYNVTQMNGQPACQTFVLFPHLAYATHPQVWLANNLCHQNLPLSGYTGPVSFPRTFHPYLPHRHYTSLAITVRYGDKMMPDLVCVDTAETRMAGQFAFAQQRVLRNAPPEVKQLRDFGVKIMESDPKARHSDMQHRHWGNPDDKRVNAFLMADANLAALFYFKQLGANLVARGPGGKTDLKPLMPAQKIIPAGYDIFGHALSIPQDDAVDLFTARQGMRDERLKLTGPGQFDNLLNLCLLGLYRDFGPKAVTSALVADICTATPKLVVL